MFRELSLPLLLQLLLLLELVLRLYIYIYIYVYTRIHVIYELSLLTTWIRREEQPRELINDMYVCTFNCTYITIAGTLTLTLTVIMIVLLYATEICTPPPINRYSVYLKIMYTVF